MTEKERWKSLILEAIDKRDISKWLMPYLKLPCVAVSSVEKQGIVEEEYICPYCFKKTKESYECSRKYGFVRTCKHCGQTFDNNSVIKELKGSAAVKESGGYRGYVFATSDTINGIKGALYIGISDIKVKYMIPEKRIMIFPEIEEYGFMNADKRYHYCFGVYTKGRLFTKQSYCYPDFYADDDFLAYAKEVIPHCNLYDGKVDRLIEKMEGLSDKESDPNKSVSAKQAKRFMEEYHIHDINPESIDKFDYLFFRTVRSDNLKNKTYYRGYCSSCKSEFSYSQKGRLYSSNQALKCSRCEKGDKLFIDGSVQVDSFVWIEKISENVLLLRIAKCSFTPKGRKVSISVSEWERILFNFEKGAEWKKVR